MMYNTYTKLYYDVLYHNRMYYIGVIDLKPRSLGPKPSVKVYDLSRLGSHVPEAKRPKVFGQGWRGVEHITKRASGSFPK